MVQLAKGFKGPKPLDRSAREPVLPVIGASLMHGLLSLVFFGLTREVFCD